MGEVVTFGGITTAPHAPDDILEAAKGRGMHRVLVVGVLDDGKLWFSGSHSDTAENLFALERAKVQLLKEE